MSFDTLTVNSNTRPAGTRIMIATPGSCNLRQSQSRRRQLVRSSSARLWEARRADLEILGRSAKNDHARAIVRQKITRENREGTRAWMRPRESSSTWTAY
jgi:hypothetical protein